MLANNDPLFESDILSMIATKSVVIQRKIDEEITCDLISEQITASIRDFIKSKLAQTKHKQEKEALYTLIQACSFSSDSCNDLNGIRDCIGVSRDTLYKRMTSQNENDMETVRYQHVERKRRK